MKHRCRPDCARALLVGIAVFICPLAFTLTRQQTRTPKKPSGTEPFATFHVLDRQLTLLGNQSAALQKALSPPNPANVKTATPAWQTEARQMGQTVSKIEKLARRLQRRYRANRFAIRLFRRLQSRAASVQAALSVVRTGKTPADASTVASEVDKRIVALGLEYNAITAGYAALRCRPGEWTCCEPRQEGQTTHPNACRWLCTKQAHSCRGFIGPRAERRK